VDICDYAIANALPRVQDCVKVANATSLPFADDQFDFVISINTVHNLGLEDCATALREIQRVAKVGSFVTVDAYRNESEKERMEAWNLTALTMMSTQEWEVFFRDVGYSGDYFWFIP
jgi:ubiquinone/menaquinone biosynthesis C-methylase UbiE